MAEELNKKDDGKGYSGIDIEEAKRMLKNEDQYDKQLYRERIKRMHRVCLSSSLIYLSEFFIMLFVL